MTQEHPITPPPELVEKWIELTRSDDCIGAYPQNYEHLVATQAARWGANQELEACVSYVNNSISGNKARALRAARRPKPPSLKEQALDSWDRLRNEAWCEDIGFDLDFIRGALESLPD